jgi:hemoglobin
MNDRHPNEQSGAPSLFERYGGSERISGWVMAFYEKVRDSRILAPYFRDTEFPRLLDHQTKFISSVMGGPLSFDDAAIAHAHKHLAIDREAFDHLLDLFRNTLVEFNVAPDDIRLIMAELRRREHLIISEKRSPSSEPA